MLKWFPKTAAQVRISRSSLLLPTGPPRCGPDGFCLACPRRDAKSNFSAQPSEPMGNVPTLAPARPDSGTQSEQTCRSGTTGVLGRIEGALPAYGVRNGKFVLQGDGIGAYWSHVSHSGWYLDAVTTYAWLHGGTSSDRGIGAATDGGAFTASLETGIPFAISGSWTIEPQGQIIAQHISPVIRAIVSLRSTIRASAQLPVGLV